MAKTILIVEKLKDWESFYPVEKLMTPYEFLVKKNEQKDESPERIKVINLCGNYRYLSNGYYCSLLAEARGYTVIPSNKTIIDLSESYFYHLATEDIDQEIQKIFKGFDKGKSISIKIFFGNSTEPIFQEIARQLFDLFPTPLLQVDFKFDKAWEISSIRPTQLHGLLPHEQDIFAKALDDYSNKIWRKPKSKKKYRYDMAILHNPIEVLPPSCKKAISHFISAGKQLDVAVELIEKKDFTRISEFDALFIRETTALNHYTYRFAKKAELEGVVVVDDPTSILRCTNKIFLENILNSNNLFGPKTVIVAKNNPGQLLQAVEFLGYPVVIKIPDGSFSTGVFKVESFARLQQLSMELFKKTSLLIFQEYFYTEFDWRIGIFNERVIFACKYFMTKGHWQILNHSKSNKRNDGKKSGPAYGHYEAIPLSKVPKHVLQAALKVSYPFGNGLYGVDIKERDGNAYIIEVNDNPNIDHEVEDGIMGEDLYYNIIQEFVRRIEGSRR